MSQNNDSLPSDFENIHGGSGKMGDRIHRYDWSQSSLGAMQQWPSSLVTVLNICLEAHFPMAIYWGEDFSLLYNDAWSPIPGIKNEWALGQPGKTVWPEIWDEIGPIFNNVLTKGESVRSKDSLLPMHRHGYTEECYFDYSLTPIRIEGGKVGGILNAVIETSYRVINERRTSLLQKLGDNINKVRTLPGVWTTAIRVLESDLEDFPFCMFYSMEKNDDATAKLVASFGIDLSENSMPTLVSLKEEKNNLWPFAQVMATSTAYVQQDLHSVLKKLPAGPWPEECHQAMVLPVYNKANDVAGFMVAGISARLQADEKYIDFIQSAATQLGNAIANIEALEEERRRAEALAEIDKAKTVFFSNISHEFRTPLTLMLGPLAELLNDNLQEETRQQLSLIQRNGERMMKLVNTLLEFARIEAGRVQAKFQPVDLEKLTIELSSTFRSAIEKAGLTLKIEQSSLTEKIYVDVSMWERVIFNLLSNALKFTFDGGITINFDATETEAVVTLSDTGVGIPAKELPQLFERFHRVEGMRSRTHEGSGIGLALVYQLVKIHGGAVDVKSRVDQGTSFIIKLPYGKSHLPADQVSMEEEDRDMPILQEYNPETYLDWLQTQPLDASNEPVAQQEISETETVSHLLIVDDNLDMRNYLERLLQAEYKVTKATNGKDAWEKIQNFLPDLVLSDVMMPVMDGVEFVEKMRADPRTQTIPIILLSARAGEDAKIKGFEAQADDYLTKPFSAQELKVRIKTNLRLSQLHQKLALQEQQARKEAEKQHNKLVKLFEQAPVAIAILSGPEFIIEVVNPIGAKLWGIDPDESIGLPLFSIYPEAVDQGFKRLLKNVYSTGKPFVGNEVPITLMQQGKPVTQYFNFVYEPWRDEKGDIIGIITMARGVTEHVLARGVIEEKNKALQKINKDLTRALEEEYKFTALLQNSSDFIGLATPEGKGIFINPAGLAMIGLPPDFPVKDFNITEMFFEEDIPFLESIILPALEKRGIWANEFRVRHFKTGDPIPVFYSSFPVRNAQTQELIGIAAIIVDITERKKKEEELKVYREQLDTANQQLAAANEELTAANEELTAANEELQVSNEELSETNEQLNRVNSDLDNFVYMASHDLKAPIANIEGLVDALEPLLMESSDRPMAERIMSLMNKSIFRFKNTLNDLAQITSLQREIVDDLENISIENVVQEIRLDLATMIEDAKATFEIELEHCPAIWFSAKNMRSILYNLISNAVKYRSPKRLAKVYIHFQETQNYLMIIVSDNGLGMDMSQEHKIFAMFKRLHNHVEGTGLGLYIVKKIIENAGGKINLESQLDVGSTFTVYFKR